MVPESGAAVSGPALQICLSQRQYVLALRSQDNETTYWRLNKVQSIVFRLPLLHLNMLCL